MGFVAAHDDGSKALLTGSTLLRWCNINIVRPGDQLTYIERDGLGGKVVVDIIERVTFVDGGGVYE